MKTVEVVCAECGKVITKLEKEVKRSIKKKRKFFCDLSCSCKFIVKQRMNNGEVFSLPKEYIGKGKSRDKFSDFRPLLKRVKNRRDKKEIQLTVQDISDIWERQNGICIYTNMKLELPSWNSKKNFRTASIDRIDPSKGYTKENCQIVSVMANFAKNDFTHEDMIQFCKEIINCGNIKN
jgi:hypothetical protein